jgi:decaprenylphospho-beta-D-ribofuranose 2-oxidase
VPHDRGDGVSRELLSGWGRTAPTAAEVERPGSAQEVAALLAGSDGRGVAPRGLGRSYGDASQNAGGRVLLTERLSAITQFDGEGGAVTAQAGLSLDALMRVTIPNGWFVPVSPGTRYVTLGGAFAADIHGKNHHRDGSFSEHVDWIELATPAGELLRVQPGSDLFHATAGGMGLTGVVTRLRLRLIPVAGATMRVTTERVPDLETLLARVRARENESRYSVAWVDCLTRGSRLGRGVLMSGDHAPGDGRGGAFAPAGRVRVPLTAPPGLLNAVTCRAFNAAYYHRAPRRPRTAEEPIARFFHPLDAVLDWNRIYGPRGFVQYQSVVPLEREDVVRAMIERLSGAGTSSFLAVLKRFGRASGGHLSFPAPGWTLALDIPAGVRGLRAVLDELDALVVGAGGRVYLAKDSRTRPELIERMYPRLPEWRAVQRGVDPEGVMRSDLDRRLGLVR